jgi:uncharacterized protein (TIGR01777 family)
MKVVVGGGTGFLGSALADALRTDGHDVVILTRRVRDASDVRWEDAAAAIDGADVVVNLAGEPLDAGRWTVARKASILKSRVAPTKTIVNAIGRATRRPRVLLNASAVGIYGNRGSDAVTEESTTGSDFLATSCVAWEAAAMEAAWATRVVLIRSGLVLDRNHGALPRTAAPFKLFVGGPLGSGDQYWSWIHRDDWTRMVRWAIDASNLTGPLNVTAPAPVTNREFARAVGRALHRPSIMPAPAFALRLVLGEMADAMVLSGQRVLPAKAGRGGFEFRYPDLDAALTQIYRRGGR